MLIGYAFGIPLLLYLGEFGIDLSANFQSLDVAGMSIDPIIRARLRPRVFIEPTLSMWVIVGLSVIYPALKAARLNPISAMRHN